MKIDITIGNPPYQQQLSNGGSIAIYQNFMYKSNSRFECLIIPARWMSDIPNGISEKQLSQMRQREDYKYIIDYEDSTHVFNEVNIAGGVCYYLIDKNINIYNVTQIQHTKNKNTLYSQGELLVNNSIIRDLKLKNIVKKVIKIHKNNLFISDFMESTRLFSPVDGLLESNWNGYKEKKDAEHYIKYYASTKTNKDNKELYVKEADIPESTLSIMHRYKLFIPAIGPVTGQVINMPFSGGLESCCSRTFITIHGDEITLENSDNIIKYFKTKFLRALVRSLKNTQHASRNVYKYVPIQDFSVHSDIDWSQNIAEIDNQLFEKYYLNSDEIAYIEKLVSNIE